MHHPASHIITAPVLVLVGPTAVGKTRLALALANRFDCEIISVDSMQVYRYMNIGTAKPTPAEQGLVPHHLIDILDPDEPYDAAAFAADALAAIKTIHAAGKVPLLTGGTGLYLRALTAGLFTSEQSDGQEDIRSELHDRLEQDGKGSLHAELERLDPETAARVHPNDTYRLLRALEILLLTGKPWSMHIQEHSFSGCRFSSMYQVALHCDRGQLYERIDARTDEMLQQGLVAEVEQLRAMGYGTDLQSMQAIGYRHINNFLDGKWDLAKATELLARDTRRYAKRQFTWFRKDPSLVWRDREDQEGILKDIDTWLKQQESRDSNA